MPERCWASHHVVPESPLVRTRILPRLKKEYRGKALGPSGLRHCYNFPVDTPEIGPTSLEKSSVVSPRTFKFAPACEPSVGQVVTMGRGSSLPDAANTQGIQKRVEDEPGHGVVGMDSESNYCLADLPEIPDERRTGLSKPS